MLGFICFYSCYIYHVNLNLSPFSMWLYNFSVSIVLNQSPNIVAFYHYLFCILILCICSNFLIFLLPRLQSPPSFNFHILSICCFNSLLAKHYSFFLSILTHPYLFSLFLSSIHSHAHLEMSFYQDSSIFYEVSYGTNYCEHYIHLLDAS